MCDLPRIGRGVDQLPSVNSVPGLPSHANDQLNVPKPDLRDLLFLKDLRTLKLISWIVNSANSKNCRGLSTLLALFLASAFAESAFGGVVPEIGKPTIGWNGNYLVGRWTQVVVPVTAHSLVAEVPIQLQLTAVDSDGNQVEYISPAETLKDGQNEFIGLIKVGRLGGEVGIRVLSGVELKGIPGKTDWLKEPLKPSVRLIVTVGAPRGFDDESESSKTGSLFKVVPQNAEELPTNPLAYDAVSALVIAGSSKLAAPQAIALRDWVSAGGRLVISLNRDPNIAREFLQPIVGWLPAKISDQPVVVREFGGLETFAGKNIRIPQSGTLSIPSMKIEAGEVLAASRSDSFLVRVPYGMGAVSILAMDLTSAPLTEWKALPQFCARLAGLNPNTEGTEKTVSRGAQLSSTGITDLATQAHAIQDHFERVSRSSPWFVISLLFLLMVVIGPIDYLVVHRVLKKPQLTWISYPCLVAAGAIVASWIAVGSNGITGHANQLDIVNIDAATGIARGRHFINLYSPTTCQTSVAVEALPLSSESRGNSKIRVSWQGVPETTFGGMLRNTGLEQGAHYQQVADGQLSQLPLMQWSSKALVAESSQSAAGLVESQLRASPTGRLTGTVFHRLSDSIEDWMIVYKTVVYRHLKNKDDVNSLPLPPNQLWRVDQPSVFSRELRPYLTGIITMATPRFGEAAQPSPTQQQTSYDPLSLDPASLVRILTFHQEVGGERYTGLTNQILDSEDLSHLLKLGRAILFGRLKQSTATIQEYHKSIEPDRQTSFIRLILPVAQPTEVIKELKRVVPE